MYRPTQKGRRWPMFLALLFALAASLADRPGHSATHATVRGHLIAHRQLTRWPECSAGNAGLFQTPSDPDAGQDAAVPLLVLPTDGRPSTAADTVRAAAAAARSAGITVYTIGLGADVDPALLVEIAGDAARHHDAPSAGDLQAIFDALLSQTQVVCHP